MYNTIFLIGAALINRSPLAARERESDALSWLTFYPIKNFEPY